MNKETKKISEQDPQFDLQLKEPFSNNLYAVKNFFFKRLRIFESKLFIRNSPTWILIGFTVFLVIVQFYYLNRYLPKLPGVLPVFKGYSDLSLRLAEKEFLYLFPTITIVSIVINSLAGYKVFNRRPHTINFALIVMFSCALILTLSLAKLIASYNV
ncbi:hypothetical protein H6764_02510 [Candidatus Nomurabacteria bacterium]|nr:hypothetical protein [Candidatus Nomurabacteria bacterium]